MKVHFKVCMLLLSFSVTSICMEQQIVFPKAACEIFENSKNFSSINREKRWYGLMCAVWYEDIPMVKQLLQRGALDYGAVEYERERIEKLKAGIFHYHSHYQNTFCRIDTLPLTLAKYKKNQTIVAELEKIKYVAPLENDMCPLYALAAYLGDLNLLNSCIAKNDFNPKYYNERGGSLLAMAVRGGHEDVVGRLLQENKIKKYINMNSFKFSDKDFVKSYAPALWIAAQNGYYSIAEQLLKVPGIDVNADYYDHGPAICAAAENKHTNIVELLCEQADIDINEVDVFGNTALHYATRYKDIILIKTLLKKKADTQKKNKLQRTALDLIKDQIPQDVLEIIFLLNNAETKKNGSNK
jgi:ankyrin repeat protein